MREPRTTVQKIFDAHRIHEEGGRCLLYIDRIIIADTALAAFRTLHDGGYSVRNPSQALFIPDHYTASAGPGLENVIDEERRMQIRETESTAKSVGVNVFGIADHRRGIQHVVSTEQGYAQPGITIAGVDSHTSTQGAVGALALSLGSDLVHALATQCIWIKRPGMMRVRLDGRLNEGITAKDVALALIAKVGSGGALGLAVEFSGSFTSSLSLEGRMTLCNMSVEMGGRVGIIAPDEATFGYLHGRPFAPTGRQWDQALRFWKTLASDEDAQFDREAMIDVARVEPMVTWGNSAEDAVSVSDVVPDPNEEPNLERRARMTKALEYMGLRPFTKMTDIAIDQVFIGSCTNSRIEDLRAAARILSARRVVVRTLVVPGSSLVKAQAEAEGLDGVFRSAGARWGDSGCSMCVSMNGDTVPEGARCASTSNRNHVGRQGRGSRTHLVSPPMAALAAVMGHLADIRAVRVD
jgi:3-isopropylmalate/(R)-2-methylmalate dehydratase large subunit